jgi:DNA-binding transcriptional LysR family regulator
VELVVEDSAKQSVSGAPGRLWLGSPHVMRLSDFAMKRLALLEGVGFGWMPVHLVDHDLAQRHLVPLRFVEGGKHAFAPQLAWRRTVPLGRAAKWFLELFDEETAAARVATRATGPKGRAPGRQKGVRRASR